MLFAQCRRAAQAVKTAEAVHAMSIWHTNVHVACLDVPICNGRAFFSQKRSSTGIESRMIITKLQQCLCQDALGACNAGQLPPDGVQFNKHIVALATGAIGKRMLSHCFCLGTCSQTAMIATFTQAMT